MKNPFAVEVRSLRALAIIALCAFIEQSPAPAATNFIYDGVILDNANSWDGYPVHLLVDGVHHMWWCSQIAQGVLVDSIWHSQKSSPLSTLSGWSAPQKVLDHTGAPPRILSQS